MRPTTDPATPSRCKRAWEERARRGMGRTRPMTDPATPSRVQTSLGGTGSQRYGQGEAYTTDPATASRVQTSLGGGSPSRLPPCLPLLILAVVSGVAFGVAGVGVVVPFGFQPSPGSCCVGACMQRLSSAVQIVAIGLTASSKTHHVPAEFAPPPPLFVLVVTSPPRSSSVLPALILEVL